MKYFRMDSDLPDWEIWDSIRAERPKQFQSYFVLYMVLYARMSAKYIDSGQESFDFSTASLAKKSQISRQKFNESLSFVGEKFDMSLTFGEQTVNIIYPNFLKKQRLSSRDGKGKYA